MERATDRTWSVRERGLAAALALALLVGLGAISAATATASTASTSTGSLLGTCKSSWTSMPATQPPTTHGFQSNAISITSATSWTVGGITLSGNQFQAIAEYWGGGQWQLGSPAQVAGSGTDTWLTGVQAFPVGASGQPEAWAVGMTESKWNQYQMLIEHWVGPDPTSPWQIVTPPTTSGRADLLAVTGSNPTDLWAVGFVIKSGRWSPLAVHWDGTSWSLSSTAALPKGTNGAALLSVTATSPTDVWAVGWQTKGFGYSTLVEHFDGTSWTIVPSPDPGTAENVFTGAASASPGDLWAVGYRSDGTGQQPLAAHYQSGTWSVVPADPASGPVGVLRTVAVAPATSQVWAAGTQFDPSTALFRPLTEVADLTSASPAFTAVPTAASKGGTTLGTEFHGIAADPVSGQVFATGYPLPAFVETICPLPGALPTSAGSADAPARGRPDANGLQNGAPGAPAKLEDPGPAPISPRSTPAARPQGTAGAATVTLARDVTTQVMGTIKPTQTFGAAVGDFSGPPGPGPDGYPDFELGRHGQAPMMLWVNQADGTWKSAATSFPTTDRHMCAWGDVAGPSGWGPDGLPDLYCAHGAAKGVGVKANEFWVQQPDGTFVNQVSSLNGLDPFGRGRAPVFFYTGDTTAPGPHPLSMFLGQDVQRVDGMPNPNRFYLNEGGTLVDDPAAGLDREIGGLCAQPVDYNQDHYTDLLVCTVSNGLALYRNNGPVGPGGTPTFTNVASVAKVEAGARFGLMADFNGDGCPDLAEVLAKRVDVLLQTTTSSGCGGTFPKPVWSHPLANGQWAAAGDVNGDGAPDLFVMQQGNGVPHFMFLNNGTGTSFESVPIPEPTMGSGESVWPVPNPLTGLTDFLVLNGAHGPGQIQLIRFVQNPAPSPLTISSGPADPTSSTDATFEFSTTSTGVSFVCSLDGADPVPCASGVSYSGLAAGPHVFDVWTMDSLGATAEATWSWTIQ